MKKIKKTLIVGPITGHHFDGRGSLIVSKRLRQITKRGKLLREGLLFSKKWMFDSNLFQEEPSSAWAVEHWVEWR